MGKVIAIANHKGGVAKTTTAINLGAAFVELGKKVLLIDVDPQCNLSETMYDGSLGDFNKLSDTIYSAMLSGSSPKILPIKPGFDFIPGDKDLLGADTVLDRDEYKKKAQILLRDSIAPLKDKYDYIIIDCPPSRNIVTVNALSAADEVIIPTLAQILSVRGMNDMNELICLVRDNINPELKVAGLLLVMFGDRSRAARETAGYIKDIAKYLNTRLYSVRIRKNVAVVESQMAGCDLFARYSGTNAADDYLALAKEYLGIIVEKVES